MISSTIPRYFCRAVALKNNNQTAYYQRLLRCVFPASDNQQSQQHSQYSTAATPKFVFLSNNNKNTKFGVAQLKAFSTDSDGGGSKENVDGVFVTLKKVLSEDLVKQTNGIFSFILTGSQTGKYFIDLKRGQGSCGQGDPEGTKSDVTFTLDSADFVKMFRGELKPTAAFFGGKLKIDGNMGLAMKLDKLMGQMKEKQ